MLCSCSEWPSPGMYTVTSLPLDKRTRVIFRSAEFGFLGVIVRTRRHTPRFCGHLSSTGDLLNLRLGRRRLRTSWLTVGIAGLFGFYNCVRNRAKRVETNKFTRLARPV